MQFYVMAHAFRGRPVTMEPYVQSQARPCGVCKGKNYTLQYFGFPPLCRSGIISVLYRKHLSLLNIVYELAKVNEDTNMKVFPLPLCSLENAVSNQMVR